MIEGKKPTVFQNISKDNVPAIENLERDFKNADFITQAEVKKYAQKIIQKIEAETDQDQKKIFLIDCLRDDAIFSALQWSDRDPMTDEMVSDSIKAIKKQIIYELKPYLHESLYLFIQANLKTDTDHFNKTKIVHNSNFKRSFLKETNFYPETIKNIRECLVVLKKAVEALEAGGGAMPYVVNPEIIDDQKNPLDAGSVYYTVEEKNLMDFEDILEKQPNELSIKQIIEALIDCIKGARFLAEAGLTLTDMQIRNMGINKKTNQGIIFDLDGLVKAGKMFTFIIGPKDLYDGYDPNLFPPEYRRGAASWIADSRSMIWELGYNINIFARSIKNKHKQLAEQLQNFAKKMTANKMEERPDFDTCITELTKIVEENFKNQ